MFVQTVKIGLLSERELDMVSYLKAIYLLKVVDKVAASLDMVSAANMRNFCKLSFSIPDS